MSGTTSVTAQSQSSKDGRVAGCQVVDANGSLCGETENIRILEQFQRVYAERLKKLDGDSELAMNTLKSWVHDLTEQNSMLVHTVEELERELLKRVDLMHDQLQKTSLVIKRNEHLAKREKSEVEINLKEQVHLLQKDVSSLLEIINQAKQQGFWSVDNVKLHTVSKSQLISPTPKSKFDNGTENHKKSARVLEEALRQELSVSAGTNFCDNENVMNAFTQTENCLADNPAHCMGDGNITFTVAPCIDPKSTRNEDCSASSHSEPLKVVPDIVQRPEEKTQALESQAAFHCDSCCQLWGSNPDKVYQTCFPVPVDQERIIICTVRNLVDMTEKSLSDILTSAVPNVSHCQKECPQNFYQSKENLSVLPPVSQNSYAVIETKTEDEPATAASVLLTPITFEDKSGMNPHEEKGKIVRKCPNSSSCDSPDSPENRPHPNMTTVSSKTPESHIRNLSEDSTSGPITAVVCDSQNVIEGDVDCLKTQLLNKDAEIHSLLERIEEMQDTLTLTSKQMKQAVEAEQKSMRDIASCGTLNANVSSLEDRSVEENVSTAPWVQERLKQQQDQVVSLILKIRNLESDYNEVKLERDHIADELEALKKSAAENYSQIYSQTSNPTMIIMSKELESTRQKFAEATKQVQSLAASKKDLEKKNYEIKTALTTEVAIKHEKILELRKEIHYLEEQVQSANTNTQFRDDIVRQLRNQLKFAQNKVSCDSGSDSDNQKPRRKAFPPIPEASSVSDSGVDDGVISLPSHRFQVEVELLRSQLNQQSKQILDKDKEIATQKQRIQILEGELNKLRHTSQKAKQPQPPSINLRELEEYRLCTVEGQAAVEELRDEIDALVSDLKSQEAKVAEIEKAVISSKEVMQNAQQKLAQAPTDPVVIHQVLGEARDCIADVQQKSDDFVRERQSTEQRRSARERKVDKLQEQLDASHDNMRDGIETMEQALAERYEADRLSLREFSDGSSYHSCRDSDSSSCLKQVEQIEENNAELLNSLSLLEHQKRDAEVKASHCLREMEKMKEQMARRSFTDELIHTKEQTILELQGALESARRQMRDLQTEFERATRERDSIKMNLEQQSNSGPLQVAELQSELARVRNQLAAMNNKQALLEQYERRLKDSSEQAEKLSGQLNALSLNLQAKETMLSNKEEMINILQDTLDRTREEMKLLKDKSVGGSSSSDKADQDEASGSTSAVSDEQWQLVRELKLDLSVMLAQYQDCFSEVSRQSRWYQDLREAYQELRSHADSIKKEALITVNASQREIEALKRQCQAQGLRICQLKEQVWEAEQGRQRAESEMEDLQGRITNYSQQICQFQSRLESLQVQLKDTQTRMTINEEQVELQQLREFREKWERAARTLADVDQLDKDSWGGLQWCESSESEDSQKREAKLEATLGLLLVEACRRRRMTATARDVIPKDSDSASTDGSGSTKSHKAAVEPPCDSQWPTASLQLSVAAWSERSGAGTRQGPDGRLVDAGRCRVHGPAAAVRAQHQRERESAERRRRLELEKKSRALRNVARCEACRSFVKAPLPPDLEFRDPPPASVALHCGCERRRDRERDAGPARSVRARTTGRTGASRFTRRMYIPQPNALPALTSSTDAAEASKVHANRSTTVCLTDAEADKFEADRRTPPSEAEAEVEAAKSSVDEAETDDSASLGLRVQELYVSPNVKADLGLDTQSHSPGWSEEVTAEVGAEAHADLEARVAELQAEVVAEMDPQSKMEACVAQIRAEGETQAQLEDRVVQLQAEVARLHDCLQAYAEADSIVREIESVVRDAQDALSSSLADGRPEQVEAGTQTATAEALSTAVQAFCQQRDVRSLAELAEKQLRLATERRISRLQEELAARRDELGALGVEVVRLRGCEAEARRLVVSVLCGFELEAQLRELDAGRLQRQYLDKLRRQRRLRYLGADVSAVSVDRWRCYARQLEEYCVHVLWSPQGQLQGVIDENQQLRDQLGQLRAHNASLASQLQEQYDESARCLADISSTLDTEVEAGGRAGATARRDPGRPRPTGSHGRPCPSCSTLPATRRSATTTASMAAPSAAHGRVSRASSCGSSVSSSGRGGRQRHHRGSLESGLEASLEASPASPSPPWDFSDHADLCDSGFWSLQASPPRSSSVLAHSPASARLCWLGRPSSPGLGPATTTATPRASTGTTFILDAHRPRHPRH